MVYYAKNVEHLEKSTIQIHSFLFAAIERGPETMLKSITIQETIFLYWKNYPEFSDIQDAVKFAQKIYLGEHRNTFQLIARFIPQQRKEKL
jgi:hypothetical protein